MTNSGQNLSTSVEKSALQNMTYNLPHKEENDKTESLESFEVDIEANRTKVSQFCEIQKLNFFNI